VFFSGPRAGRIWHWEAVLPQAASSCGDVRIIPSLGIGEKRPQVFALALQLNDPAQEAGRFVLDQNGGRPDVQH
jgi:hypothetical protein